MSREKSIKLYNISQFMQILCRSPLWFFSVNWAMCFWCYLIKLTFKEFSKFKLLCDPSKLLSFIFYFYKLFFSTEGIIIISNEIWWWESRGLTTTNAYTNNFRIVLSCLPHHSWLTSECKNCRKKKKRI